MDNQFPRAMWRLVVQAFPSPAALNLAVDEAVLRAVAAGTSPPTLRLYAWSPPALILGRGQSYAQVNATNIIADGLDVVRRMSGGTAVLSVSDFSYAVCVPGDAIRLKGAIGESYQHVSAALVVALQALGIGDVSASQHSSADSAANRSPVCFEIPSMYEITVDGRKVVGNSQMRIRNGILQHGSIPLTGDMGAIARYLNDSPSPERIRQRAATLFDVSGRVIPWALLAEAIVTAFASHLNLNLAPGALTSHERTNVEQLLQEKYANSAWTQRV